MWNCIPARGQQEKRQERPKKKKIFLSYKRVTPERPKWPKGQCGENPDARTSVKGQDCKGIDHPTRPKSWGLKRTDKNRTVCRSMPGPQALRQVRRGVRMRNPHCSLNRQNPTSNPPNVHMQGIHVDDFKRGHIQGLKQLRGFTSGVRNLSPFSPEGGGEERELHGAFCV
jgi:hypothetical protein